MEAEVLNPRMMADVNGNNKTTNAELEVLKLQELVRKLERQNEQLRTRANAVNNRSGGGPALLQLPLPGPGDYVPGRNGLSSPPGARGSEEEPFAYFQPSSVPPAGEDSATALDELDVLDLDAALPAGEPHSWLYVSPKARGGSALSPLQWCRQVLDHPGPEVQLAKMTLCHRLDQAKRWRGLSPVRPYSCIEGLFALSCPVMPYTKPAAPPEAPDLENPGPRTVCLHYFDLIAAIRRAGLFFCPLPPCAPSVLHPLRAGLTDRAPTFLSNSTLYNAGRRQAAISPQSSLDSEVGVSELEDDSISMSYKLQDMTDVEVMARLQEESLRQDYASTSHTATATANATATAGHRRSSFSLHSLRRSEMDLEEEDEEEEDKGYDQLPPPQPRLFGSVQRGGLPHSHTFSSIRDCRRSSIAPQFSLSGLSQYSGPLGLSSETHAAYRNSTDKLRRSMPNLIRSPSMPSVPSIPCLASPVNPPSHGPSSLPTAPSLRSSQSFDSSSGLARLQSSIPSPGQLTQRVQSVGNFPTAASRHPLKATAYVSPTVQQGPASRSLTTSVSLHSIPGSTAPQHQHQPLKPSGGSAPQPLKAGGNQRAIARSSLPRPASFVGTGGVPRAGKTSTRSMLTPPRSLAALTALRDGSWRDGCY
ncbi:SLAIN motif-containing protein 1a isoform X2 [Pseudoliparis swirei]|uniref:SLAIN motif-containing protein 1a isoform X2 n=1 Tax=Pseudoliparis swirei TaxID=2059687 RepID=UPI0024BE3788|nr:SLAIN motif-containing protein 1a isoform X2 [Pseudoliparis swirei]